MTRRIQLALLFTLTVTFLLPTALAQEQPSYAAEINSLIDQFEQIQASLEVAFRAESYINSLQALRYRLKRLDETFSSRAEARYVSFALAHATEDTYLSLIKKMQEGNGAPPDEAIEQATAMNQGRIAALKSAVRAETTGGGEAGWSAVIEAYFGRQDYNRAIDMAEQAAQAYPNSTALADKLNEVRGRIDRIKTSLTEANGLIETKDYHGALKVLDEIAVLAANDASVQELRRVIEGSLAKIGDMRQKALEAETAGDVKLAFKTWSGLLELEPGNEEAQKKIAEYKEKFRIVIRRVYRTCPTCKGTGDCDVCEGSKLCLVCNGYARCLSCKGRGYHASTCIHCVCRECQGTGRCVMCGGDSLVYCAQCRGRGYFTTKESRTCPVCRGSGKSRFSSSPCTNCGGSGSLNVNVDKPCSRCGGRKVERCSHCSGGFCPSCNGRGRAESCAVCKGLGRVITECPYCKGTSICLTCDGKGTCRFCKGTGRCSVCAGKQLVVQELEEQLLEGESAGTLAAFSEPQGAQLYIDGADAGTTPHEPSAITEGQHTVRLQMEGYMPAEGVVDADPDSLIEVNVTLVPVELYNLRVLAVTSQRHAVLFKHYTKRDDGSFMASLMIDGKNRWVKDGEFLLGYQATRLDKIEKEQYNPRVGGTAIVDLSKLVLTNRNGEQLELTLGMPVYVTSYTAKLYDREYNATWSAREGSRISGRQVKSISREQVVFISDDGQELVVPVQ